MPVKKRAKHHNYSYDFTVNGNRFRGSCETDDAATAKAIEAKLRTDAVLQTHLGKRAQITLNEALARYWKEHAQHLKSANTIKGQGFFWVEYFGTRKMLHEITDNDLSKCVADERVKRANGTINRRLALLSGVFTVAGKKWKMDIGEANIRQHMLPEPQARTRWITREEADTLIKAAADHLKPIIRFALLTGCRKENIIGLKWEQVNLHKGIIDLSVKSHLPGGKNHAIVISRPLQDLLLEQVPQTSGYVFTYASDRVRQIKRSWKTACKNAKIKNFRFHDLRHTAASWMVQAGVPLDVIQEILGHSQIAMTQKYAHRDTTDKADAMDALAATPKKRSRRASRI